MNRYLETNRSLWNRWTPINARSELYDVEGFKAGASSLMEIEVAELGDVSGKTLLHLQCHFGLDTFSWARRGATVTGVDFSDEAIALARALRDELDLPATFIHTNLYALPDLLNAQFDIVYTSYGVLTWLPDLVRWAEIIAHFLRPGGTFYIVEFHPILSMLHDDTGMTFECPYFSQGEPMLYESHGSYAGTEPGFSHPQYEWRHSLADIINALIRAGLQIEFFHEFPYSPFQVWDYLQPIGPDRYAWHGQADMLPHVFSIRASARSSDFGF